MPDFNMLWPIVMKLAAAVIIVYAWYGLRRFGKVVLDALAAYASTHEMWIDDEAVRTWITWAEARLGVLSGPDKMLWVLDKLSELGYEMDESYVEYVYQQMKAIGLLLDADDDTPSAT